MRLRPWLFTLAACALICGCSPKQDRQASNVPAPAKAVPEVPAAAHETPEVKPAETAKPGAKPPPPTSTPPSSPAPEWKPSSQSPRVVAQQVDSMLSKLTNVSADVVYRITLESGDLAGELKQKIKSPTVYSLEYPVVFQLVPDTTYTVADGKTVQEVIRGKPLKRPVSQRGAVPKNLVESFPELAPREIFASLLDRRKPFTEYVDGLLKKESGYSVFVQERAAPHKGRMMRQYRIYAYRKGPPAAKLGTSEVSIIVDADIHLPVVVSASILKPGASRDYHIDWTAKWQNNQKFNPKDFIIVAPKPVKL